MSRAASDAYCARFRKVFEYVDAHLEGDLGVERLSEVAAFSKYHFHRQFSELFGIGVYRYVQLVRLKRAAHELAFRDRFRIIDIALASGYDSHEAFSRAFKKVIGQTPAEFRREPHWELWHDVYQPITDLRRLIMSPEPNSRDIEIVVFQEARVAILAHRGDPRLIGETIRKFIEWRRSQGLTPSVSATYNLLYNDPETTPVEEFRLDLCAGTDRAVTENPFGVVAGIIPGGRCARLPHVGSDDTLGASINYLYRAWLPASGEELRDFPLFIQRLRFFPDVAEHEAVSDLFLPLR